MNAAEAVAIVKLLADGQDPVSGCPVHPRSILNHPDVIRALQVASHLLDRAAFPPRELDRAGARWTYEEDCRLRTAYLRGDSVCAIAERHGRSQGSIYSRLEDLREPPTRASSPYQRYLRQRHARLARLNLSPTTLSSPGAPAA